MRTWLATEALTIHDPSSLPATFVGLELVFYVCAALTLVHALRHHRKGDGAWLFAWVAIFTYGISIEILSYNFLDNFTHGQFSVMLYHQKLPLYISVLYPVFIYTAMALTSRLGLGRVAEPFAVGFMIVVMDFPFDVLGPDAGWWTWSNADPVLADRFLGVPVTSYYWHLAFGGIIAALCRTAAPYVSGMARRGPGRLVRHLALLLAAPVALLTLVLGVVAFLPFHALSAVGVPAEVIVAGLVASAGLVLVQATKRRSCEADRALAALGCVYYPFFLVAAGVGYASGGVSAGAKLFAVISAVALAAALNTWLLRARPSPAAAPA